MFGLQKNDNAKHEKISVLFISIIIVKNINPELYAGCFYLIVELNVWQRKRVLYSTANDPQPQMIPRPQMIPKMDPK